MRVNFVSKAGPHLASYRLRIEKPAEYLRKRGWDVVVGDHVPADVHVFAKHWAKEETIRWARESPHPVFDVCDDHFEDQHADYYREMVGLCDVVCSSPGLRDIAGKGVVIEEPYELPRGKVRTPTARKALWFGHKCNLLTLEWILPLLRGWKLRVISNIPPDKRDNIEIVKWSVDSLAEGMQWCHVVLLPQAKLWKNANRLVETLRSGRLAVVSPIPAYTGWGMPTDLKIFDRDWTDVIRKGQERVRRDFSPDAIGSQWEAFLNDVVNRGVLSARDRLCQTDIRSGRTLRGGEGHAGAVACIGEGEHAL